jgi:hypothetical protein
MYESITTHKSIKAGKGAIINEIGREIIGD